MFIVFTSTTMAKYLVVANVHCIHIVALLMKKTLLDHVRLAKGLITTPLRTDVRMQLGHFPMTNSPKESATG